MRFVFLNQFYPPEVAPTGVMLEAVAAALGRRGHAVTVVCGKPAGSGESQGGREMLSEGNAGEAGGVEVVRLWAPGWGERKSAVGKVLSYAAYYFGVAGWLLRRRERAEVVVALTSPPFLSILARMGAWWHGGRHAHWVMDLYPDVMVAHGMLKEKGLGHRLLGALGRWGMGGNRCHRVITLGPDMAERVQAWLPEGQEAVWVPLWGTAGELPGPEAVADLRGRRGWTPETVVFLYSGNMGLGHRFTEVLAAMPRLKAAELGRGVHLAFFGGGKRQGEIRSGVEAMGGGGGAGMAGTEVLASLRGFVPREELAAHLGTGDVHLVSLDPAWDGMMVPSKLQGIFGAGRPVIFTGSAAGSLGRWILESGAGWVCAPGDVEAHVRAMREALDAGVRAEKGAAARRFAEEWFDQGKNVERMVELLVR